MSETKRGRQVFRLFCIIGVLKRHDRNGISVERLTRELWEAMGMSPEEKISSRTVRRDLEAFLDRLAPDGDPLFTHVCEGEDDMPAHVKAALTRTSEQIPVSDSRLTLGTWQGLYVWEHRSGRHRREVVVHVLGE